jgi:alpha-L-rhamnosidase
VDTIVSDRNWMTALGPSVTSMWYSGTDYDARREQPGWDAPGADLSATATRRDGSLTGWIAAGIAPPPNLNPVDLASEAGQDHQTFTPVNDAAVAARGL